MNPTTTLKSEPLWVSGERGPKARTIDAAAETRNEVAVAGLNSVPRRKVPV